MSPRELSGLRGALARLLQSGEQLKQSGEQLKWVLGLPFSVLEKARNNQDFLMVLATLATTRSAEERTKAFRALGEWRAQKFVEPGRGEKLARARGFASELLGVPWVMEHLSSTPYLGLLPVPPGMPPCSRLDYVAEIIAVADEFKQKSRGFGLGSPASPTIDFGDQRLTDLELIQAWAILQSASHLFGTFATERALLFTLRHDAATTGQFEVALGHPLRSAVESLLQRTTMYSFGGALMGWRATRHLEGKIGECARSCVAAYLDRGRYEHPREIFRRLRQLASLRLQDTTGVNSAILLPLEDDSVLEQLMPNDGVVFRSFDQYRTPLVRLTEAVDDYQYSTYFTGDQASSIVLNHLREFKKWWAASGASGKSVAERVDSLFSRPSDWPVIAPDQLKLVGKLIVGIEKDHWYDEVKAWWDDGRPWSGTHNNFFLSHAPRSTSGSLSLYGDAMTQPATLHHVLTRLCKHSTEAFSNAPQGEFWRSLAAFLAQLLAGRLVTRRKLMIDPIEGHENRIGYVVLAERRTAALERVEALLRQLKDLGRVRELQSVTEYFRTIDEDPTARWIFFLGKVRCFHVDEEGTIGHEDGDLDGVIGRVTPTGTAWDLLEVKGGNETPDRQSRKSAGWFGVDATTVETKSVQGARLGIVRILPAAGPFGESR